MHSASLIRVSFSAKLTYFEMTSFEHKVIVKHRIINKDAIDARIIHFTKLKAKHNFERQIRYTFNASVQKMPSLRGNHIPLTYEYQNNLVLINPCKPLLAASCGDGFYFREDKMTSQHAKIIGLWLLKEI